ncbi:MAG: hemerythrin domain-containing protein [Gammaproteobacteria bacterium]
MKRSKGLVRLAREHHTALVLAKRAQRIDLKNVVAVHEYMAAAVDNFDRELGSHFQFEEDRLLPLMMKAGEAARVQRTVADHEELRQLIDRLRSQTYKACAVLAMSWRPTFAS